MGVANMTLKPTIRVWRYMSFSKLVWILQKKQLWLSNANYLDDRWEVMPLGQQLNKIITSSPTSVPTEEVIENTANSIHELRNQTFINCWTASEHESHALWRIYCPSSEGVAIVTTLDRLKRSIGLPVLEVTYDSKEENISVPSIDELVTQKRPMFAYENEVRVVLVKDYSDIGHPDRKTIGVGVEWDPELHLEGIYVHPEAQFWFMETVTETVRVLAPKLSRDDTPLVWWSKMSSPPPL